MDLYLSARWVINTLTNIHVLNTFCSTLNIHALFKTLEIKDQRGVVERVQLRRLYLWWDLLFSILSPSDPLLAKSYLSNTIDLKNPLLWKDLGSLPPPKKREVLHLWSLTSKDYLCHSSTPLWAIKSSQGRNWDLSLSLHQYHYSINIWEVS